MTAEYAKEYMVRLSEEMKGQYVINPRYLNDVNLKRGLRNADGTGVLVGVTGIGSVQGYYVEDGVRVPQEGRLYYRGISMEDIVEAHRKSDTFGFEEVVYLLVVGKLPTKAQLEEFNEMLAAARDLPKGFYEDMILKIPSRNVMNKLARCVLALYSYDEDPDDTSLQNMVKQSIALIARFPTIVAQAYATKRHHFDGKSLYIHNPKPELSISENFLRMIRADKSFTHNEALLLDLMLMIQAEHGGGNNSAFVCRALSSTMTDTYSAIAGAIGSLKGPLHGGANSKVMEMFGYIEENVKDWKDDEAVKDYLRRIVRKEAGDRSGKIYGLGHAVYTVSDPRAKLIRKYAVDVAKEKGYMEELELLEKVEEFGVPILMEEKEMDMPICANVDLYSGLIYKMLGIPEELCTPLFAVARISGWCAHRIEEVMTGGRLMRPAYRASMIRVPYIDIENRK